MDDSVRCDGFDLQIHRRPRRQTAAGFGHIHAHPVDRERLPEHAHPAGVRNFAVDLATLATTESPSAVSRQRIRCVLYSTTVVGRPTSRLVVIPEDRNMYLRP